MQRQDRSIDISLQSTCTAAQLKYTIMKSRIQQPSANEQSLVTCQVNSAIVGNINVESVNEILASGLWMSPLPPADTSIVVDESQSIQEQIPCKLSETSTAVAITDIESIASESTSPKRPSPETSTVYESQPILEENTCSLSESCIVDITNTPGQSVASKSVDWPASTSMQKPSFETATVYESPPVLVQIRPETSEINATTVDPSDTESTDEILASGPSKWPAPITTLPEAIAVYESPPVLEEMPCDLSEISTDIEDSSDIESIDEILASGLRKWTIAAAGKEVFDSTGTSDEASKNPLASYSKHIEISAAVDIPSHEHLTGEDSSATQAFDPDTELGPPSKNPLIQHIEDSETLEKNPVYIYELPALPAFDLTIDIDFGTYTTDTEAVIQRPVTPPRRKMQLSPFRGLALRNKSFGWSRSCTTSSISRRTSSISTCTTVSDVTFGSIETAKTQDTVNTEFCEGEQLSCSTMYPSVSHSIEYTTGSGTNFYEEEQSCCSDKSVVSASIECIVSEHSDFYGGEQFCSSVDVDTDDIVCSAVVVVDTDALTLTAGMVKKKKFSWMGLILLLAWAWIEYMITPKHKGLPKVKIKKLSEPEHTESRSQELVAGIPIESAYKIALFSGIRQRLGPLR